MAERRPPLLFRCLVRLYPSRLRRLDGDEMWATFRNRLGEARRDGSLSRVRIWAGEIGAALTHGLGARLGGPRRRPIASASELLLHDVRSGVRSLRHTPIATVASVLTLALGIGANVTVFTLTYSMLWRSPEHVREPERLVTVSGNYQGNPMLLSYPAYVAHRDRGAPFDSMLAYERLAVHLNHDDTTERLDGMVVSGNYFDALGVVPALGRLLAAADDVESQGLGAAVVSHGLWTQRFGGDVSVLHRIVRLNGHPFRIVGVTPKGFGGLLSGAATDIWVPISMRGLVRPEGSGWRTNAFGGWLTVVGRLEVGIEQEAAAAQVGAIELPEEARHFLISGALLSAPVWVPLYQREGLEDVAMLLLAAVAVVMVITCANLAGLLLVRATNRVRELTIRAAIGATRGRLFRQLLLEGLLLTAAGTAAGLLLSRLLSGVLRGYELAPGVSTANLDLTIDSAVLLFAVGTGTLSGLIFSVGPAFAASSPHRGLTLRNSNGDDPGSGRVRSGLVVCQIASSVVLLVVSSTLLSGLVALQRIDPGFDPVGVVRASVDLELDGIEDDGDEFGLIGRLVGWGFVDRNIAASAASDRVPLSSPARGSGTTVVFMPAGEPPATVPESIRGPDGRVLVLVTSVTPRYHWTLQIPIRGRVFYDTDRANTEPVAIVSQALADMLWPAEEALGQQLRVGSADSELVQIVGVAGSLRRVSNNARPIPELYRPIKQRPSETVTFFWRSDDPERAIRNMRGRVQQMNPNATLYDVGPLSSLLSEAIASERLSAAAVSAFAAFAIFLSALGLYGVVAQVAGQRRREFGIRIALGASLHEVRRDILAYAGRRAVAGVALGTLGAWLATRALSGQLVGLGELPAAGWAALAGIVVATALIAAWAPARRATRVDPVEVLRAD